MARLYSNENFPLPVVEELRRLGHAVLTTHEAGEAGNAVPDEQILAFAAAEASEPNIIAEEANISKAQTTVIHTEIPISLITQTQKLVDSGWFRDIDNFL